MKTFYITTPIYYPNARPHVGSAYTTIACDAIARYKRMCGYDVAFLTGTDEHGEKLQRAADYAGVDVKQFVAEKRELFKNLWRTLGISAHDSEHPAGYRFVHTSQNPAHVKSVHWMIRQAKKAGYIEKKKYEGRYCVFDERYVSDSVEPANCDICGRPAELISEENYFFKLSEFQGRLLDLYDKQPTFVQPDFRMNEVKSFVKSGLRDISISRRRLKWGIPWPDDPDHVVYVWYDALTSYLTGIGFEGERRSKDFEKYWMGAEGPSEVVHMIGKDILRFHAVYWPAFLMAANDSLPDAEKLALPKTIFAHGWIYYEQDKMSKSKGNVVYPEPIIEALNEVTSGSIQNAPSETVGAGLAPPGAQQAAPLQGPGNDALRYYLLRDTPFGRDGSFSYEGLIQRYNSDLANDLGNLTNRTLTMIQRFSGGTIPFASREASPREEIIRAMAEGHTDFYSTCFSKWELSRAMEHMWELVAEVNKYIRDIEPWTLSRSSAPDSRAVLDLALYTAAEALRFLSVTLHPVLPEGTRRLWRQLGCEGSIEDQRIKDLKWGQLKPGAKVGKPEPIFPRLDKEKTLARLHERAEQDRAEDQIAEEASTKVESQSEQKPAAANLESRIPDSGPTTPSPEAPTPESPKITIDDFAKVDLRAGTIRAADPIPGATKLLKLQVDIGSEVRQVCAGIAEYYKPEQLIGMKVVIVANLQPRKLRGIESNGMIVAASVGEDGRPVLVTFNEDVPNGAKLK